MIEPNTICKVMEAGGIRLPDGAYTRKIQLRCIFPDAHSNNDIHKSAWLDGIGNMYGCQRCGTLTARGMAERLNVPWPLNGHIPIAPGTSSSSPSIESPKQEVSHPAPTVEMVRAAVMVGIEGSGTATAEHPVFAYLAERGLDESSRGPDPLALIWPEDGAGLPECYVHLARRGYRVAVRLYDSHTGALASLQARYSGPGDPPDGKKVLFTQGAGQAAGKVFANLPAVAMMRGTLPNPPARAIMGEGLTDFLALASLHPDLPVIATAGSSLVDKAMNPPPKWLRPGMEVVNVLDGDEPGEVGVAALVKSCRAAGAICRRVNFPAGSKDACDILKQWGADVLKLAVTVAELPISVRMLSRARRTLGEYRMRRLPTPDSIIGDGLLRPRQFGFLFGAPGAGKSWVALELGISAAAGRDWYGIKVRPCRVAYFSLELEEWDLRERCEAVMYARGLTDEDIGDRLELVSPPDFDQNFDILNPDHALALQSWIQESRLDLAILDTLSRAHTADERDMRPVMAPIQDIVRRTNSGMILVHHPRKPAQAMPGQKPNFGTQYDMRGDSRMNADGRLVIGLSHRRKVLELSVNKANTGKPFAPIFLKPDENGVLHVTELPRTRQEAAAEARSKVIEAIEDGHETRAAIVKETGIEDAAVKRALANLVKDGAIMASGSTKNRTFSIRTEDRASEYERPNQEGIDFNEDDKNEPF